MTMIVERKSPISGEINRLWLDITQEEYDRWQGGELVQNVWPYLSADEREFLMTGITPNEWQQLFGGPEDPRENYWNDPCEMDEEDESNENLRD